MKYTEQEESATVNTKNLSMEIKTANKKNGLHILSSIKQFKKC